MTELFDEDEKTVAADDEVLEVGDAQEIWEPVKEEIISDARRRLEDLLDERKLKVELDDYFELDDF